MSRETAFRLAFARARRSVWIYRELLLRLGLRDIGAWEGYG